MLVLRETRAASVRERWDRVARLGLPIEGEAYPTGTNGSDLAERRDRLAEVFREEKSILAPLAAHLAARALVAIVADADGVILAAHGDAEIIGPGARVRLVEGARWSEDARGTNAIGTAIVERCPVAVIGDAHYEARNKGLFCYATPVRDPYGDLVAVLDVTGDIRVHEPASEATPQGSAIGAAVEAAGIALERSLRANAYARAGAGALPAIERLVHRAAEPVLLVETSGLVGAMNAGARAMLGAIDGALDGPLTCERLFGVPYAELFILARQGARGMRFETRGADYRVELDPIPGAAGRTLAVVVHLEREHRGRALSRRSPSSPPPSVAGPPAFAAILGRDEALTRAKEQAARFAVTALPILLLAETGTGKELFARAIHDASPRAAGPFVPLNCGSLAPTLMEAELFGYAPGAFTGAARTGSEGRLGAAHGGTLFLDEVAEMPEPLQAALLRVLDDGVYQRVGEARPRRADFRLVCGTCRDLPAMVEAGAFRRDLFYRVQGACITIPPLRERSDRVWLAEVLLAQQARDPSQSAADVPPLGEDARAWIVAHDWPGNVRELKSALAHALALGVGEPELTRAHFPRVLFGAGKGGAGAAKREESAPKTRARIVRDAVAETISACEGNLSEAARRLGIARSTLYRSRRGRD